MSDHEDRNGNDVESKAEERVDLERASEDEARLQRPVLHARARWF